MPTSKVRDHTLADMWGWTAAFQRGRLGGTLRQAQGGRRGLQGDLVTRSGATGRVQGGRGVTLREAQGEQKRAQGERLRAQSGREVTLSERGATMKSRIIDVMSRLRAMVAERAVPTWSQRAMAMASEGEASLIHVETRATTPCELTGIHSVIPWMMPRRKAVDSDIGAPYPVVLIVGGWVGDG